MFAIYEIQRLSSDGSIYQSAHVCASIDSKIAGIAGGSWRVYVIGEMYFGSSEDCELAIKNLENEFTGTLNAGWRECAEDDDWYFNLWQAATDAGAESVWLAGKCHEVGYRDLADILGSALSDLEADAGAGVELLMDQIGVYVDPDDYAKHICDLQSR